LWGEYEKTRGERKMKSKLLLVSMLAMLLITTIQIGIRVQPVLAVPANGPSLVVDDATNRINATLGVKASSKVTVSGTVTNVGTTPLTGLLTAIYLRDDAHSFGPLHITGEWSSDCVTWGSMAAAYAPGGAWDAALILGPAGGYGLGLGVSSTTYVRITTSKDIGTSSATIYQQTAAVFVFKDTNLNYKYDGGEPIYSQDMSVIPPIFDTPVKIDLAVCHTAEIEGTGEFYYSVQDAVNAASSTIILYPGTYAPFTVSGKSGLTIVANGAVVVQGSQSVVTHYANRDAVIFVTGSTDITLDGLDVEGQGLGTTNPKSYAIIYESSSGIIKDCTVSPNTIGDMNAVAIAAWDHSDLVIDPCLIKNFGRIGVFFYNGCTGGVYNSTIEGQVYNDENFVNYGIEIEPSDDPCNIEILGNHIYNCDNLHPSPSWSSAGIVIDGWVAYYDLPSSTVVMSCNNIYDNYYGIEVVANPYSYAHYNNIYNNREYGVIEDPDYANNNVTFDARYNWWGHASGPTHPSNPGGIGDKVSDYVWFSPWLFTEKVPPLVHDVAIISIVPSATMIAVGTTVQIDVTAKNEGTAYENFTVALSYDSHLIGTQTITDLAPGATELLTFYWDTTGITPYGDYTITAEASTVLGETDLLDNIKTVMVRIGEKPTLEIEPSIYEAKLLGENFAINITMNNLGEYWRVVGLEFRVSYNSTLLRIVNVTEGSFLRNPSWNHHGTFFIYYIEDEAVPPYVVIGLLLFPNATGQWESFPYGNGVLATITFEVIYQDRGYDRRLGYIIPPITSDFELFKSRIIDDDGLLIPHNAIGGQYTIYPTNVADINYDGYVGIDDIFLIASSFGEEPGRPRWNPDLDINKDNYIGIDDIWIAASNFGWEPDP